MKFSLSSHLYEQEMRELDAPSDSVQSEPVSVEELIQQRRLLIVDYKELAVDEPSPEGFYRSACPDRQEFIYYAPYVLMYR